MGSRGALTHPGGQREFLGLIDVLREELPAQLAGYQQELAAGQADKRRRESLVWHIRRVQKRMADLEARLAKVSAESGQ